MLSKTLALAIAIVLFVELLRDKRPRYLVSLCAGGWVSSSSTSIQHPAHRETR